MEQRMQEVGTRLCDALAMAERAGNRTVGIRTGGYFSCCYWRGLSDTDNSHRLSLPLNTHSSYCLTQSLTYDGAYVGCLYCVVSDQVEEDLSKSKHFLYLHKLEIGLLEEIPH